MRNSFLFTPAEDDRLEDSNTIIWDRLLGLVKAEVALPPQVVVDVGCHGGGLLAVFERHFRPSVIYGIEPVPSLRERAGHRLRDASASVNLLDTTEWDRIPSETVDLLLCVEVLYLLPDISDFFGELDRVLSDRGRAYIVLGCHTDNPVWTVWKPQMEALGHVVFDHNPMDILRAGAAHDLLPSVRPLYSDCWVTHDPRESSFTFQSVAQMLDHHCRYKLLFRFLRQ